MFYGSGPLRPSQSCIAGSLCPPICRQPPYNSLLRRALQPFIFRVCFALLLGLSGEYVFTAFRAQPVDYFLPSVGALRAALTGCKSDR